MTIDSKALQTGALVLGMMFLGIIMAISVATNAAGGIAALVPMITVILTLLALINPRAGLFGLAALVIWVDEFKRLAVYFGGAYSTTVVQTLAMPFIVLAALNAGFFLNLMFGKVKIDRLGIMIYLVGGALGLFIFKGMEGGLAERGQRAANIAGYITLIPIAYTYFKNFEEWRKFFAFQVIVALPAAAWAIKQYYYGFDQIEWEYARSGLSKVHYGQMFGFTKPRTFGFFGSASALGCASIYCAFSWWQGFIIPKKRLFWFLSAMILSWVLVISTQRTILIYPLIVLVCTYLFRTKARTLSLYGTATFIFLVGVANSTYMLEKGLDNINRFLARFSGGGWGQEVLRVSTFSDRLRGWERLTRPETYSLFGTKDQTFGFDDGWVNQNHDIINKILISYGVIGLICTAIPGIILLRALHSTVFVQSQRQARNDTAFAIALSLPIIVLSFLGGDNFNTNPINLQIWTAFVGVLIVRKAHFRNMVVGEEEELKTTSGSKPMVA